MTDRLSRRSVLAATALSLAGCRSDGSGTAPTDDATGAAVETPAATGTPATADNPAVGDVPQRGDLELTSTAFDDGGVIPARYGRDGENVNPPLSVANVPSGAETLTLLVDDPDAVAVAGEVFLHWLVWNVPASTTSIPAEWGSSDAVVGVNGFGNRRYDGPAPPDGEHSYRFKLYALETALDLPQSASKREVGTAMNDRILARTQLTGRFG